MRPTRYEHGTYVATPHRTTRGFLENAAWHHHTTRANTPRTEAYGWPEIIGALCSVPLFIGLWGVGWCMVFFGLPAIGWPLMVGAGGIACIGAFGAILFVTAPFANLIVWSQEQRMRKRLRHLAYDNGEVIYVKPKQGG